MVINQTRSNVVITGVGGNSNVSPADSTLDPAVLLEFNLLDSGRSAGPGAGPGHRPIHRVRPTLRP
jgi:hypothetical protein